MFSKNYQASSRANRKHEEGTRQPQQQDAHEFDEAARNNTQKLISIHLMCS